MKKILILMIFIISGCSTITKPNTNYVRTGALKDRYTTLYYHYVEAGKSFEINNYNSVNSYIGLQDSGSNDLLERTKVNPYWEVNYQLTF